MDEETPKHLDRLVEERLYTNRSKAVQDVVEEKLGRLERNRLARACAKLDRSFEKEMADEGMDEELLQWPGY